MFESETIPTNKFDYASLGANEYLGLVQYVNDERRFELASIIDSHIGLPPQSLSIITIGSDGKRERHGQSKTELILLSDGLTTDEDNIYCQNLYDLIYTSGDQIGLETNNSLMYVYDLSADIPFSYVYGNKSAVYPDFILNSIHVLGNPDLHYQARRKIISECSTSGELGKRIKKYVSTQLKDYKAACKTGVYGRKKMFTNEQVFYDEKNWVLGYKITFLRVVQRYLDRVTFDFMSKGVIDSNLYIETCGTNTVERIEWLDKLGCTSFGNEFKQAYIWFLQHHHKCQELYLQNESSRVQLDIDPQHFSKNAQIIMRVVTQ